MARKKQSDTQTKKLFPDEQGDLFERSYQEEVEKRRTQPVECLGMTFENDEKRREYFLDKLREKLKDPEFRKIEGFPTGEDEDILALSDPPYYTACPNPFIADFIEHYGKPYDPATNDYRREPFAVDVSEGKQDPIYKAHSYHTKVPHLAIVPSILHYTNPDDIVLDGFCGSGMTGVAAQWCETAPPDYRRALQEEWKNEGLSAPQWGMRRVILNDLSPAATFIAANHNIDFDVDLFESAARKLLKYVESQIGWMYETKHKDGETKGRIEYTVWSELFSCPDCSGEIVFMRDALDSKAKKVKNSFDCPHCGALLKKNNLDRVFESRVDPLLGVAWKRVKYRPWVISYIVRGKRYEKFLDSDDLALIDKIQNTPFPKGFPAVRLPIEDMYHGSRLEPKGITHIHHFYTPRAAHAVALLWKTASNFDNHRIRQMLLYFAEQALVGMTLMNRHHVVGRANVNQQLTGVYYIPSLHEETAYWRILEGKLNRLIKAFRNHYAIHGASITSTASTTSLNMPESSIDYVFTDPPFGENIFYADLNLFVESWHKVITSTSKEAIIDKFKQKALPEYQHLMQTCFEEYCRVLKPGRWITVVFHNSRNAVWNAIQEGMFAAGFVVADVRTLDKQQGSYRQITSTAVKQDLVISAYRPNGGLEERFKISAGTEDGVWDFIRTHLKQLPVFVSKDGQAEVIAERQNYLLFDRMVAFHVQRGVTVPLSAAEFYAGLEQRFPVRDGMYFLSDQAAEYDKKRMTVREILQLQLFVSDEASAIQWLKQQLTRKPQSFQDIHPQFMKEIGGWQKYEKPLELSELLEQNFLRYDGKGDVPSQIHSYLSSNFKELRNLEKDDPSLKAKAKDRWYVPDPNKAGDLEKLRERALMREFEEYRESKQKRLKVFRLEAVRAGFRKAWQEREYATIIAVARKIPENVLQEDAKLLMWYDQALTRMGE
jgi:predicted RNA-binding Zn-ribbon protein involved in translation (DUF1610 family)